MKKKSYRRLSIILAAILLITSLVIPTTASAAQSDSSAVAVSNTLPDTIEEGAILHCWCWSFNTIKSMIPQIAEAGFKSIQTSPINKVWVGENGGMQLMGRGKWWYQYQPTDYTIGNYQLGTKDEFMAMCTEAHRYGVKVIVDIVANHCASDYSKISSHVKNITNGTGKAFHDRLEITDRSNRYQVTQGKLSGLYDLNTQNSYVQQMIVDYLSEALSAGADGFRYDAAKHIELPDDAAYNGTNFAGNFWPTVLDNNAEFQYGEILTGADRASSYAAMMRITADSYGSNLRTALSKSTITSGTITNYRVTGVNADRLVTWVESHDNYTTDDDPDNGKYSSWYTLNNKQIQQGWAIIAAQGDTTPLFFARPKGNTAGPDGSKWGDNQIGIDGDGNYFTPEVVEVNKFRNAMLGESKKVSVPVSRKIGMIQRGGKGTVLVSVAASDTAVNAATDLPDGEYTDRVGGGVFTVTNGTLSGTVKAGEVVVLYQSDEVERQIGDIDNNGILDINDVTYIQRFLAEYTKDDGSPLIDVNDPEEFRIADVDKNGRISIADATMIQRILAEFIVT